MINPNEASGCSAEPGPTGGEHADGEDRLGLFAAAMGEYAIVGLAPDGTVSSWNPGAERITGYASAETVGRHFSVLYPPGDAAGVRPDAALQQAAERGSYAGEGWRLRKDGSRFWAFVVIVALRSSEGRLVGFTKLVRDETESRTRRERSNRRFEDLFGFTPVGLGLFGADGKVVDANEALAELLGYERHQLRGMRAADLLHPQDRAAGLVSGTRDAGGTGDTDVAYRLVVRADGRPVYCQLRSAPSVQEDGSVLRVAALQPVTERLREAEALRADTTRDYLSRLPYGRGVSELLGHLLASADDGPLDGESPDGQGDAFQRINDSFGVSLASPLLIAAAARQLQAQQQLADALREDGLALHYQPFVAADGTIVASEALVRWPHPAAGLLTPGAFLPLAERGGLLAELDRWVLRTALREAGSWPCVNGIPVSIAVNLAGLRPGDVGFAEEVAAIIDESGIDRHRVVLELVETALVDLPARPQLAMRKLADSGVRFAVDDFGTGHSSLARLRDLPAQIIKTDRRFVAGLGQDASDLALATAIAQMARALGRQCVAEGVETTSQFEVLTRLGVDAYQGWLFSHPLPAGQFRTMLSRGRLTANAGSTAPGPN